MPKENPPLLRILCLHGKQQTKEIFRSRLGRLPKKVKDTALLTFIDAPFTLPLREGDQVNTRSWYEKYEDSATETIASFKETLLFLQDVWNKQGPFDGVLGFSQGASVACAMTCRQNQFPGLKFAIVASSVYRDFLWQGSGEKVDLPSMHIYGSQDKLVLPKRSLDNAKMFNQEKICLIEHEKGHCFPSQARYLDMVVEFLKLRLKEMDESETAVTPLSVGSDPPSVKIKGQTSYVCESTECAQEQAEEIEAMISIYPNVELLTKEEPKAAGDPCGALSFPLACSKSEFDEKLNLQIFFTPSYPNSLPELKLSHSFSMLEFPPKLENALLNYVRNEIESLEGMQCSFSAVGAAEAFLSDDENLTVSDEPEKCDMTITADKSEKDVNEILADKIWEAFDEEKEDEMVKDATRKACEEVSRRQKALELERKASSSGKAGNRDTGHVAQGRGIKKFTVGLVGKPSAGKSTFFNCVTRLQNEAKVGAHPFTTIEPNFGTGWWASNDAADAESKCETQHGREANGRRILPLLIKDVAGLIPGAYKGHGKGNRFLNDLCDADILVHIVDCSGTSDKTGNQVAANDDTASTADQDIKWVREELHRWIFGNVSAKWRSVARAAKASEQAAENRLYELFSGYKGSNSAVKAAVYRAKLDISNPANWSRYDLHCLVAHFLSLRFPMCMALNKCDKLIESGQIEKLNEAKESALKLGYVSVPMSASVEAYLLWLASNDVVDYGFGANAFSVPNQDKLKQFSSTPAGAKVKDHKKALELASKLMSMFGGTGVLNAISTAVALRDPLLIYPVFGKSSDVEAERPYCLQCLPGSTVEDVFKGLKNYAIENFRLDGDFVRAEVKGVGESGVMRLCGKDMVLDSSSSVLRILTNRKVIWQTKEHQSASE